MSDAVVTLQDIARREDPQGKIDKIAEILTSTNEVLQDMHWQEGNLPTGHKTTVRTGLPDVTWRLLNYGVQDSKSATQQITATCGMLEAYSEIDKALADLNGNTADFRLSEDRAFLESMNQEFCRTLMYGDKSKPEQFVGFAPRYGVTSGAPSAGNVIDAGGTGADNTSIYLVGWGPNTVFGIYPKGLKAGISHTDLSKGQPDGITLFDKNGGKYQGYRTHYKWDCGLCVRDWRYVVRIANIDVSDLTKNASAGADLIDLLVQAEELLPTNAEGSTRLTFLCNKTIRSFLRRQMMNKTVYQLTQETVGGKMVTMFDGIPVRRVDALLNAEARVV
ncbi:phage protein [Selenomonas sp. TAMA-11512]|uniref:major capsid protein n=1 Tax=Selenomonas sp. TAMA-11512 TaxID=3095337 RepID=UPI0030863FB1|nr:phage protein [Selenomonas sp. TAMA-11512]